MGFFSSLFDGGKKNSGGGPEIVSLIPPWQEALGQELSDFVQKYLKLYEPGKPYGGEFTAPLTGFEETGLSDLGNFLNTPITGDLFGAAKGQILDTLSGKYADPGASPFIQSITRLAGQNLDDLITESRGRAGARGSFFTRSAIQEETDLSERTQNFLNTVIGDFVNKERGRQLSAVPFAQSLEQYGGITAPLERIKAATTFGAIPRVLEQADLEAEYSDFGRQQKELGTIPGIGTKVFSRNIPVEMFEPPAAQPSGLNQILNVLGQLDFGGGKGGKMETGDWVNLALKVLPFIFA